MWGWAGFGGLTGVFGLYLYLTYVELSWDIMEPVSYFTGGAVVTLAYAWWCATKKEYEYENIYQHFLQKRQKKNYQRFFFYTLFSRFVDKI